MTLYGKGKQAGDSWRVTVEQGPDRYETRAANLLLEHASRGLLFDNMSLLIKFSLSLLRDEARLAARGLSDPDIYKRLGSDKDSEHRERHAKAGNHIGLVIALDEPPSV